MQVKDSQWTQLSEAWVHSNPTSDLKTQKDVPCSIQNQLRCNTDLSNFNLFTCIKPSQLNRYTGEFTQMTIHPQTFKMTQGRNCQM